MTKQYKLMTRLGKDKDAQTLEFAQGVGAQGKPVSIQAKAGARYQLVDTELGYAPQTLRASRAGKNLQVFFAGSHQPDLIIENYYDEMPAGYNALVGQAKNGNFYEYIPEDADPTNLIPLLVDGTSPMGMALGGSEVTASGAAVGAFLFNPLWLAPVGLAALGGGGGGGSASGTSGTSGSGTAAVAGVASPGTIVLKDDVGAMQGSIANGAATDDTQPTITGTGKAGEVIKIYDNGNLLGSTTVGTDGIWTFMPTAALATGAHSWTTTATKDGQTSDPSAAIQFTVVQGPNASIPLVITALSDDLGSSGSDFITGDNTLKYFGTVKGFSNTGAAAGDLVKVELKNAAGVVVASDYVLVDDKGGWQWDREKVSEASGTYTLVASIVDAEGKLVVGPVSQSVIIDRESVTAETSITGMTKDAGVATDFVTSDISPGRLVYGSVSKTLGANQVVKVISSDGKFTGTATADAENNWTITDTYTHAAGWTYSALVVNSFSGFSGNASSKNISFVSNSFGSSFTPTNSKSPVSIDKVQSAAGNIDNEAGSASLSNLVISGTTNGFPDGSPVNIYINTSKTLLGTAKVMDGKWTFSVPSDVTLGAGAYQLSADVQDPSSGARFGLSVPYTFRLGTPTSVTYLQNPLLDSDTLSNGTGVKRTVDGLTAPVSAKASATGTDFSASFETTGLVALFKAASGASGATKGSITYTFNSVTSGAVIELTSLNSDNSGFKNSFDIKAYDANNNLTSSGIVDLVSGQGVTVSGSNITAGIQNSHGAFYVTGAYKKIVLTATIQTPADDFGVALGSVVYPAGGASYAALDGSLFTGALPGGGTAGKDSLTLSKANPLISAGGGDDVIHVGSDVQAILAASTDPKGLTSALIDGGGGGSETNKLVFDFVGTTLDLTNLRSDASLPTLKNIQVWDVSQGGIKLTLSADDVLSLGSTDISGLFNLAEKTKAISVPQDKVAMVIDGSGVNNTADVDVITLQGLLGTTAHGIWDVTKNAAVYNGHAMDLLLHSTTGAAIYIDDTLLDNVKYAA